MKASMPPYPTVSSNNRNPSLGKGVPLSGRARLLVIFAIAAAAISMAAVFSLLSHTFGVAWAISMAVYLLGFVGLSLVTHGPSTPWIAWLMRILLPLCPALMAFFVFNHFGL